MKISTKIVESLKEKVTAADIPCGFFYGEIGLYGKGIYLKVEKADGVLVYQVTGHENGREVQQFRHGQTWGSAAPIDSYRPIKSMNIEAEL